jgi:hypothetical protein
MKSLKELLEGHNGKMPDTDTVRKLYELSMNVKKLRERLESIQPVDEALDADFIKKRDAQIEEFRKKNNLNYE